MAPQSPKEEVMAVLDEVRGELNSSFPHRPGDAERVSRALCQALQILNCLHPCRGTSCRRHDQRSSWAYSRSLSGSTSTQVSDSSFNHHDGAGETGKTLLGAEGVTAGEERADRARKRRIFLETFYLPFASFLLRNVGPSWIPFWDTAGESTTKRQSSSAASTSESRPPDSSLDVFKAFFRPPTVPASLALLALSEALGKEDRGFAITRQMRPRLGFEVDSSGDGKSRAGIEAVSGIAAKGVDSGASALHGDRTVHQHVCRLLEPFLGDAPGTSKALRTWSSEPEEQEEYQQRRGSVARDQYPSLLAQAVLELIDVHGNVESVTEAAATAEAAGDGCGDGREDDDGGTPLYGVDAAEILASALCLAPRRVANSLGSVAPPTLAPSVFYPAVCRAAMLAIVRYISTTVVVAPGGRSGLESYLDSRDGASAALRCNADSGYGSSTDASVAAADVWWVFSGKLLAAGRSSDLAEAWLRSMAAEDVGSRGVDKGEQQARVYPQSQTTGTPEGGGSVTPTGGTGGFLEGGSTSDGDEKPEAETWEDWANDSLGAEIHSGLMTRLPASWRKPFTEALLRALWPHHQRSGLQRQWRLCNGLSRVGVSGEVQLWPEGFPAAACRVLVGRPLLPFVKSMSINIGAVHRSAEVDKGSYEGRDGFSVGIVEELVLQRPLPTPAAEAIAETLAWCDRRRAARGDCGGGSLLMGAVKRVAAVWAEPSFVNHSPSRQQDFYTRFLLGSLRSGGIISDDLMSKDPETLPLLIRGVGTRLDVSTRETRLQGMRVGEAAAALGGQNLRFAELDDERGQNDDEATEAAAKGQEGEGVAKEGVFLSGAGGRVGRKGEDEKKGETKEDEETYSVGYGRGDYSGLGGDDDDVGSNMEAYDLWDEEEDLVAVAEPVYLDQLIELLRSRDEPETPEKHETGLKCAEALVRRNPPDLPHRAAELSRDLLYLENAYDLEGFHRMRAGALVATVAAAPETCALYLGSEVWGTGATEGTKLEILDVLVQVASELAGWTAPVSAESGGDGIGSYPSALMREPRGTTHRSARLQQRRRQAETATVKADANTADESGGSDGVVDLARAGGSRGQGTGVGQQDEGGGGVGIVSEKTRRWGYRRGPREQLRRNLFGRYAPMFFYPLAQGMMLRLRQVMAAENPLKDHSRPRLPLDLGSIVPPPSAGSAGSIDGGDAYFGFPGNGGNALGQSSPPPPSPLFSARLLHALTCLVELCGNCPATPSLAVDLLALAWLLKGNAARSRELRRAVLVAVAIGLERSQGGAASGASPFHGQAGELLRWLQACATGSDGESRKLASAVMGHSSVQALAYL